MYPTIKTDPFTGVSMSVVLHENGDMLVDLPFIGCTTIKYNEDSRCYEIPAALFAQRKCVSATTAASILGVSRQRVNVLCNDGTLASTKVNGNMLIDRESLLTYKGSKKND